MRRQRRLAVRPCLEVLDQRLVLSALTPAQIDSAYGLSAVTFSSGTIKGTGEGQTIAIIDAYNDPTIASDLDAFDAKYGIANPTVTSTPAANSASSTAKSSLTVDDLAGSSTNSGWAMETALDVEMAHAAAPGANIVLVEAKSASVTDLIAAVNAAKAISSVSVVSMSWGSSEFNGEQSYDSTFTTPSGHIGITFIASAGDSGAGAEWPAVSPNVVGVGGTSLVVSASGTIASQTSWSSSGGGVSQLESKPSYQDSVVSGSYRSSPDVAMVADPNTGVVIVSQGTQTQVGGTSMSSPLFAGVIAIADQGLAIQGKTSLNGATQTLPDLYSAPSSDFSDVTSGSRAKVGYDTVTGLGSPNVPALVGYITGTTTTSGTGTTGTGTGTTTGTGTGTTTGSGTGSTTGTGTGTTGTGTGTTGTGTGTTGTGSSPTRPSRPPYAPPWWWGGGFFSRAYGGSYDYH